MRKSLAVLVAMAVCSLQAQALAFHVHAVPDHAHGMRHAHGPAIHDHHHHHSSSRDRVRLTADDDDGTAVTLLVPAATSVHVAVFNAVPAEALSIDPPKLASRMFDVEVRSHGPPSSLRPSFRGPPAFL